ncbi:TetR/AcrR family transcriptional regulator [Nocardioides carbamazepini]|uniref:TetR/AcrR family transcriptional regulator n=1 Tax=Nocardioides carbamazepini TaxID=2854259 RepID=UPI002149ECD2|nr:TetR/AcrR family transcriptional regulator [Nocardioides carbamazepini]MCR1781778.1 TetR/AcrR family transcriptional regulator [Nocardioides carbamazepini]
MPAVDQRAARTEKILAATRALFDERGMREAHVEDIARVVGINRAVVYRHFSSKEELFALTLVGYLADLDSLMTERLDDSASPADQLRALAGAFLDFGQQHPAFVDCALVLLRRRGDELLKEISEETMLKLGIGMASCLGRMTTILEHGVAAGDFHVEDPGMLSNLYYAQALGVLNLTHMRIAVRDEDPGLPGTEAIPYEPVKAYVIETAVAMAQGTGPATARRDDV